MQVIDTWNDVPSVPGSRTHGSTGGNFALVGPRFKGTLPAGLEEIKVDTSLVALGGLTPATSQITPRYTRFRINTSSSRSRNGRARAQKFTPPISVPMKPGVDIKTPVPAQVFNLSADQFFGRLCELLPDNPAREADAPVMVRLAKLGIARCEVHDRGV